MNMQCSTCRDILSILSVDIHNIPQPCLDPICCNQSHMFHAQETHAADADMYMPETTVLVDAKHYVHDSGVIEAV